MLAAPAYCDEPEHLAPTAADETDPKVFEGMAKAVNVQYKWHDVLNGIQYRYAAWLCVCVCTYH